MSAQAVQPMSLLNPQDVDSFDLLGQPTHTRWNLI